LGTRCAAQGQQPSAADGDDVEDYYDVLEAAPADSVETLRDNYRRLQARYAFGRVTRWAQRDASGGHVDVPARRPCGTDAPSLSLSQKRLHPDVAGSSRESVERSAAVNVAWTTLSDPAKRASYNATLAGVRAKGARGKRRNGTARGPIRREGLVGPLRSERLLATLVPRRAPGSDLLTGFELRDSLREWAKTIAFAADLPLPLPLQVDDTPSGVRLAMLRTAPSGGGLTSVGELVIEIVESEECDISGDTQESSCDWRASVLRRWPDNGMDEDTQLPGEDRIMKALEREFKHLMTKQVSIDSSSGWMMPSWLAAMGAWALPALPLVPLGQDVGGRLSAYYLQRSCRLAPDGRRPATSR
jgi:hypothetical protein